MKVIVYHHTSLPFNIQELEKYVKNVWKDISPEYYKNLIKSMPQRIDAVIVANGNSINY